MTIELDEEAQKLLNPPQEEPQEEIQDAVVIEDEPEEPKVELPKERFNVDKLFSSTKEKWIFIAFITPPVAISLISMMHMITLFQTANNYWMSLMIAVSVELAAISSLVALATLKKLSKGTVWTIFGVLAFIQIIGNMYHAFVNMTDESFVSILQLFGLGANNIWSVRLVTFMISGILPVISLTFVKGVVEYFRGGE